MYIRSCVRSDIDGRTAFDLALKNDADCRVVAALLLNRYVRIVRYNSVQYSTVLYGADRFLYFGISFTDTLFLISIRIINWIYDFLI